MTRSWIAILSAIWMTGIVAAVLLIAKVNHQRYEERPLREIQAENVFPSQQADEPVDEVQGSAVLLMPPVTIVIPRPGVAEMQGTGHDTGARPDDLIIGPGIVTHPVAIPPGPPAPVEPAAPPRR
jgi:hypothetical protein